MPACRRLKGTIVHTDIPRILVLASLVLAGARAGAAPVQPPTLAAPERGSVAGQYGATAFAPGEVSRRGLSLPGPFVVPWR